MSSIPVEIFRHVFGHFSNDKSSLFSCLLVNKTWCEIVVSILWSDPFQIVEEPPASLITTYLSCLNLTEREVLDKSGIDLRLLFDTKPTFEYAVFLRNLNYMKFYELSSKWLQNITQEEINHKDSIKIFIITRELCKLFMNKGSKILKLNINLVSLHPSHLPDNVADYMLIPCFPNARTSLSQLQEFNCCGTYDKKKIFQSLSQYCRNIISLDIDYYLDDTRTSSPMNLAQLIKSQSSLRTFRIDTYYRSLSKIIPALESQQKTLREVKFRGIDFEDGVTFAPLVPCKRLETLSFMACDNVKSEAMKPLEMVEFPRLRKLIFHVEHNPPYSALSSLIINNHNTLEEISLGLPPISDNKEDPKIIEKIIEYCQNLVIFESHLQTKQLESLLISCQKLESLTVRGREPLHTNELKEFLPKIGKIIPGNLKTLVINALWSFNHNTLKEFLDYCVAPLETLGFPDCYAIDDNHLLIFSEYAKEKGTLKKLNIKSASRITRKAFETAKSDIENIEHCAGFYDEEEEEVVVVVQQQPEVENIEHCAGFCEEEDDDDDEDDEEEAALIKSLLENIEKFAGYCNEKDGEDDVVKSDIENIEHFVDYCDEEDDDEIQEDEEEEEKEDDEDDNDNDDE